MIIGIDIGGTTTDIVGLKDGKILNPVSVKADDPIASAAGALGKFVELRELPLSEIRLIAATGVGAGQIRDQLLGIPVKKIDEFDSIGTAGAYLSGLREAIVVSMGTGTAIVNVQNGSIHHWGGSGVGGGTMVGLSRKLLNITHIRTLMDKAAKGRLGMIDLTVGDIAGGALVGLPESATASNFGKVSDEANESDIAMAIINLVGQTIALLGISAARSESLSDIVLTGKLSTLPLIRKVMEGVGNLYHTTFIVPKHAEFGTAIGAAIKAQSLK
ncbi:MAG: type II pantothenate kinase [Cytophagales bacterium]|nr:type II pantothenate kinase [Cytophagales bacterium]